MIPPAPAQPRHSCPHVSHQSGAGDTRPPPRSRTRPSAPVRPARRATRTPSCVVFAVSHLARQRAPCDSIGTASRSSSMASRRVRRGTAREETRREPAPCRRPRLPRSCHHFSDQNLTRCNFADISTSQDLSCWPLCCLPECPPSAIPPQNRARPRPPGSQLAHGAIDSEGGVSSSLKLVR